MSNLKIAEFLRKHFLFSIELQIMEQGLLYQKGKGDEDMKNYDLCVNACKEQKNHGCQENHVSLLMDVEKANQDSHLRLKQYALRMKNA